MLEKKELILILNHVMRMEKEEAVFKIVFWSALSKDYSFLIKTLFGVRFFLNMSVWIFFL